MKRYNPDPQAKEFTRFTWYPRAEHWFIIITFSVLTFTGLPQKFSDSGWARWVIDLFGSVNMLRTVHRITGWAMVLLAVEHVVVGTYQLVVRNRTTMVPRRKDFEDATGYLRWCLGLQKVQPRMPRYDYRQKFEYWGLLVGSAIMIVSGIILIFPMAVASVAPGVVIAAAKVAHSSEAMLALLTVIIWHAYGAIFNPEVFPMDRTIFTGRISRERMLHEHPEEFEEWFGKDAALAAEETLHHHPRVAAASAPDAASVKTSPPPA